MRSNEAEVAVGTSMRARAPIARACVEQEAESRHRGVGAAGRPPDRSGRVRVRSPGTCSRPEKHVRRRERAWACRAMYRLEPVMPAEPGWNGKEGQSPSPAVAGVAFERRQVRASGADDEHDSARPTDLLAASHGPGRTARAEDEVDLPRRIAVRSCILPG